MHAYQRFVQEQMDAHGWNQARLAKEAGLTPQTVSNILGDKRSRLTGVQKDKTVKGLARAFRVEPAVVWTAIAEAMGIPRYALPNITHEMKGASDEELLRELAARMGYAATVRPARTEDEGKKTLTLVEGERDEAVEETSEEPPTTGHAIAALDDKSIAGEQESTNET